MRVRLLSLRAFDADGMMIDAEAAEGAAVEPLIARLFANPAVAYIHAHNAKRGCYSGRIDGRRQERPPPRDFAAPAPRGGPFDTRAANRQKAAMGRGESVDGTWRRGRMLRQSCAPPFPRDGAGAGSLRRRGRRMKRGPLARYEALVAAGRLEADPAQAALAQRLDRLARALDGYRPGRRAGALAQMFGASRPRRRAGSISTARLGAEKRC